MKAVVITIIMTYNVLDVLCASAEVTPTQKEKGVKCKITMLPNSFYIILSAWVFLFNSLYLPSKYHITGTTDYYDYYYGNGSQEGNNHKW